MAKDLDDGRAPKAGGPDERSPSERVSPTLVLGIGNILLRDEGVGVRVIEAMTRMEMPPDVELFDGATAGLDLVDALAERQRVVVIDAVDDDSEPGTVMRLTPDDLLTDEGRSTSLHELGLLETLTAAKQMGISTGEVVIIGVRPFNVECGLELSPQMQKLLPRLIELVLAEVGR